MSATVRLLRERISEMQPLRLDDRALPTSPELEGLFPGGALRRGTTTTVEGSLQLALALISAASRSGCWCGAIGIPSVGAEAAAALGISLERFVLVPDPGPHTLGIAAALSEVLTAVLLRPSGRERAGEVARLAARLRDHGSALIVLGPWPRAEGALTATASSWVGLGAGHGLLDVQELRVESRDRRGTLGHTVRFRGGGLARMEALPARREEHAPGLTRVPGPVRPHGSDVRSSPDRHRVRVLR